jgi:hypothetical protein
MPKKLSHLEAILSAIASSVQILAKEQGHALAKREGVRYGSKRLHPARAGTESRAVL